jgi:hypothetical protein
MLATVRNEFPQFPAAISFAMMLPPDQVAAVLEQRAAALREILAKVETRLKDYSDALPRITLLEDEYARAVTGAELNWVEGVLDDLRSGAFTWSQEQLVSVAVENLGGLAPDLPAEYLPE